MSTLPANQTIIQPPPLLSATNLTCIREERLLFDQLNIEINAGDIVQIEGPNGSGKTSLLRILAGLSQPFEGEVFFNNQLISDYQEEFHQNLLYLGHLPGVKGEMSAAEFIAIIQIISFACFLLFFILFTLIAGFAPLLWFFAVLIAVLFYWLGYVWLDSEVDDRRVALSRQFPYFLDLAVMTMESGSSFMETLEFYVRDNPEQVLAEEMQMVIGEMRMGKTISESLVSLKNRIASEDVKNTVNALLQGQSLGTPLGQVLRNQADAMRFRRSQMAERIAEELKVKLQGPAMLMVISVLILILAPAFLETTQGGLF